MTRTIMARGFEFELLAADAAGEEPVVLLHGFPETSAMWSRLMACLTAAGYPCAAPDQRGYSPGARPLAVTAYGLDELADDVFALADVLGWPRFHLVAHDWGACVGWRMLRRNPERIGSFTALSIPHYRAFAEATWADLEAAPYRRFLELATAPGGAAERVLARDDFASFRLAWAAERALQDVYVRTLSRPGALTAALNWYRACDGHRAALDLPVEAADFVRNPALLLWGRDDPYVRPGAVARAASFMRGPYEAVALEAGHWLAQEAPEAVAQAVLQQLARYPLNRSGPQRAPAAARRR